VILPVFDSEEFLQQALDSMVNQTFSDFEVLVISEYDTNERSLSIINKQTDERLRHIHNSKRLGLVRSLNLGLKLARGEYVARMDADDISLPERLEKQVNFLDQHEEIGFLGTAFEVIDDHGRTLSKHIPPNGPLWVKWLIPFFDAADVPHPTVMGRRTVYRKLGGYDPTALYAEDYELWVRAIQVTRITNLRDVLLRLRRHVRSRSSSSSRRDQAEATLTISENALRKAFGNHLSSEAIRSMLRPYPVSSPANAFDAAKALFDLFLRYIELNEMSPREELRVRHDVANRLQQIAISCAPKNPSFSLGIWRLIQKVCPDQRPSFLFLSTIQKTWDRVPQLRYVSKHLGVARHDSWN